MMEKISGKEILLLLILVFSFAYRFLLMTWNIFPSGADIGLHQSTINSIMVEKTSFFWNYYHMGGGLSATNPGYHIFVVAITAFTGATEIMAQVMVTTFFSSMVTLCTFLIVRRMWSESPAFIAAFLMVFSAGDIGMLSWGGYPNLIALTLIPLVFYLYLQRSKFALSAYLPVISLLIGVMFLTHVFSALIFVTITVCTFFASVLFSKRTGLSKSHIISWLSPIVFGVLLVLPYLVGIAPAYFSSQGAVTGAVSEMKQAVLETRIVPIEIISLSFIPVFLFFLISKRYKGKYLTVSTVLLAMWILVPVIMTQSYQFNVYLDYQRFMYFLYLPVITCVALLIESGLNIIAKGIHRVRNRLKEKAVEGKTFLPPKTPFILSRKLAYSLMILCLLLFSVFAIPIFKAPDAGVAEVNAYQVMTQPGYEAIQWIRSNTPVGSVCVADANYGWWLSGFAQRPTLSAVDPQYLILTREFEPAKVATKLLTANYIIDNGLIQFQDGGQRVNNKYELSAKLDYSYFPYPFFGIDDADNSIVYRDNGILQQLSFTEIPVTNTQVVNGSDQVSYCVDMENQLFSYTREVTIYSGMEYAEVSISLQSKTQGIYFQWFHLPFQSRGAPIQYENSIGTIDSNRQRLNQLIFPEGQIGTNILMQENPDFLEMVYNLEGKATVQINFFVGSSQFQLQPQEQTENNQTDYNFDYLHNLMANNSATYLNRTLGLPIEFFDYRNAINAWNISYIVVRDTAQFSRFSGDALFNMVFKNSEVSIFKVENQTK